MKLSYRTQRQRALVAAMAATASAMAALPLYAADQAAGGIEEVVVTAQFREQKLQDTPIAITAVTADTLEARNQTSLAAVASRRRT
ncbi:MAG: hypothetical protein U1F30_00235 [Steroidobacteraceae bacterium]